jgi:transposase
MRKLARFWVGLDVHAGHISIAFARNQDPVVSAGKVPGDAGSVLKFLRKLGPPGCIRVCYEAGPTGYGLQRQLAKAGFECIVIAPSTIPRASGDKVKTDRRDAMKLAQYFRSGVEMKAVWVPDDETEALRDLVRARATVRDMRHAARQHLVKFLLRLGRQYDGQRWTRKFFDWARSQRFEHLAQEIVLKDLIAEAERQDERVEKVEAYMNELAATWSRAPIVRALQALRGVGSIVAITLAVEIGEFSRFASPRQLMAYAGLVPMENSSGGRVSRGRITRAGNSALRHVLGEAAWAYRFAPAVGADLRRRQAGLSGEIKVIAMKAQERLHRRYFHLVHTARKPTVNAATAVSRELLGFVWDIATRVERQLAIPAAA